MPQPGVHRDPSGRAPTAVTERTNAVNRMQTGFSALAGSFGGGFPSLYSTSQQLMGGAPLPNASWWIGFGILASLGAGVALVFRERDFKKAFFLGIGLPALIHIGSGNATINGDAYRLQLTPALLAAENERQDGAVGTLTVLADQAIDGGTIHFLPESAGTRRFSGTETTIAVPGSVDAFIVEVGDRRSDPMTLDFSTDTTAIVEVRVGDNPWSGLQVALGYRNVDTSRLDIEIKYARDVFRDVYIREIQLTATDHEDSPAEVFFRVFIDGQETEVGTLPSRSGDRITMFDGQPSTFPSLYFRVSSSAEVRIELWDRDDPLFGGLFGGLFGTSDDKIGEFDVPVQGEIEARTLYYESEDVRSNITVGVESVP